MQSKRDLISPYLLDTYQQRPLKQDTKRVAQDVCIAITTIERGWANPILEKMLYTFVIEEISQPTTSTKRSGKDLAAAAEKQALEKRNYYNFNVINMR